MINHGGFNTNCKLCNYESKTLESVMVHTENVHEDNNYKCVLCGHITSSNDEIETHVGSFHGCFCNNCNICSNKDGRNLWLKFHMKMLHQVTDVSECKSCGKVFCTRSVFKKPLHRKHGRLKPLNVFFVTMDARKTRSLEITRTKSTIGFDHCTLYLKEQSSLS